MTEQELPSPIQGVLYSDTWGQGKTLALVSFKRPGRTPKRLLIDKERRARSYKAPNGRDRPTKLQYSFDYFHELYAEHLDDGEWTPQALIQLYEDIRDGKFKYNVLLIDNAAMVQEDLVAMLLASNGATNAKALAQAFRGVEAKSRLFLNHFKNTDTVKIYGLVKDVLRELLRMCQRRDINVLSATEAKNVWKDYGTRDMKIMGQTAKVLSPFMQYADFCYRLSRTKGNRDAGTAKLIPVPWAFIDTFNPKNSLPGLKPRFEFTWKEFWALVEAREVTTAAELEQVTVKRSEMPETTGDPEEDLKRAKRRWLSVAKDKGLDRAKFKALLEENELTPDDAADPEKFKRGLELIENYQEADSGKKD